MAHTKDPIAGGLSCTEPGLADARARLLSTMVERVAAELSDRAPCVLTKVWRSVGADAASRVRAASACVVDRSPVCVCGHGRSTHVLDFNDGDTCESWCDCSWFHTPMYYAARGLSWSSCSDLCNCGDAHKRGRVYFVSVRSTTEHVLLLGPFSTHGEALENVDRGRTLAEKRDVRAHEYAYGTCSLPAETYQVGMLDERYVTPVDASRGDA